MPASKDKQKDHGVPSVLFPQGQMFQALQPNFCFTETFFPSMVILLHSVKPFAYLPGTQLNSHTWESTACLNAALCYKHPAHRASGNQKKKTYNLVALTIFSTHRANASIFLKVAFKHTCCYHHVVNEVIGLGGNRGKNWGSMP
uniref:Uncharacterized protein n=1 Tax=Sphaerodactylus townsendi TaxID=933632 RepID=A0ACB8FS35_9SAUR